MNDMPKGRTMLDASKSTNFAPHWSYYPRTFVAPKTSAPIHIDGDIEKPAWAKVPWSEDFDDIRGPADAPPSSRPRPTTRTRMKIQWDDEYLYVAALLTSDFETGALFTERNSPIFQKDSDFEVFLDPNSCNHNYKELEINALGTVWNLMLDKPYGDNGSEHSGRVAEPGTKSYYEVKRLKSATMVLDGTLNAEGKGATWSVELALAHSDTLVHVPSPERPKVGRRWRVNFSRVEKQGEVNWTWQPQIAWDASERRFRGHVNMHLPDAWGYVVFGDSEGKVPSGEEGEPFMSRDGLEQRDRTWPARLAAMNVYYAQKRYREVNGGSYASDVRMLDDLVDSSILDPFEVQIRVISGSDDALSTEPSKGPNDKKDGFSATVEGGPAVITVTDDRFISANEPLVQTN